MIVGQVGREDVLRSTVGSSNMFFQDERENRSSSQKEPHRPTGNETTGWKKGGCVLPWRVCAYTGGEAFLSKEDCLLVRDGMEMLTVMCSIWKRNCDLMEFN